MKKNKKNQVNEDLEVENNFLKMKMMLEHGAVCDTAEDCPPEMENEFLKSVAAFEEQYSRGERVKLIEKIGNPGHFRNVHDIPDSDMEQHWIELDNYLNEHGINLGACSPNIDKRELYRFTIEELFQLEVDDISIPGMMTCFIYDEFYPDHKFNNETLAVDDCIGIFFNDRMIHDHNFLDEIRFNSREGLPRKSFCKIVANFRKNHKAEDVIVDAFDCQIEDDKCYVRGRYSATLRTNGIDITRSGSWAVDLLLDKELDFWRIYNVQIDGLGF